MPGTDLGLRNSTLSKMESKTEITVDWVGWVRHMQQFCRFPGIYRNAFLVLVTVSSFVPALRSWVQSSTCNNNNKNCFSEVSGKVMSLQALDKRCSVWQRAMCGLRGRSELFKNMCSALSCHPNHSLILSTRVGSWQDWDSMSRCAPWLCSELAFYTLISV